MKKAKNIGIYVLFAALLTGCFKEDEIVLPTPPGDVKTTAIELTANYRYQVYYSLSEDRVVAQNLKSNWDIGFESADDGHLIILNTSSFMTVANTFSTDFDAAIDTSGYQWRFDKSDGNFDSTAFRDWIEKDDEGNYIYSGYVYVVNRGFDEFGNNRGLKKVVFHEVDESSYSLRFANLDGSEDYALLVSKDSAPNFVHFSFDDGGIVLLQEPPNDSWDILFTQYTTLLYTNDGDPYPYLVTGCLINPAGVMVARDTVEGFAGLSLEILPQLEFSGALDMIGYNWKDVEGDVSTGNVTYVVEEGLNFVIHDRNGYYHKLRFISFYSNSGEKGYPTFEHQRL
jgi:hypothetical protein